jgi:aspartyl-tRNA(Asn)/glutamyl-tRNA(Gln) amidotransferase subunit A
LPSWLRCGHDGAVFGEAAMEEACDIAATDLVARFAAGSLSPVEHVAAVLARVEAAEPQVAALWALDAAGAMAAARASEARWRRGEPIGPLDGVTVTLKELIATRGVAKPLGTAATILRPEPVDAPPAARLREAGAIILAKTTCPDFGMLSSGLSSFHRLSRNPWDLSASPGGSSAGAGSAAAAGYGPLHIGTDIGGSVRLPAGWCGVYGFKPSLGRVPIDPPYMGRVAGPMTRSVADAALAMAVLSRPDARDYMSLPEQVLDWTARPIEVRGLRIGCMMDAGCGLPLDPEIAAAVTAAARAFEQAGAIVEPVGAVLTRAMLNGLDRFWRTRFLHELNSLPEDRQALVLPYIRTWVAAARSYDGMQVYSGLEQVTAMRAAARDRFAGHDFILSPTAPVPAFPAAFASPVDDPARPFEHIAFTMPWNMSEQPAASINCGYTAAGLPIGLQIVGRRFDDVGVLRLSRSYEAMRPPQRPWPAPWRTERAA